MSNPILTQPQPVSKKSYKVIYILTALIAVVVVIFLAVKISSAFTERRVQEALDQYCGQGMVSVANGYYSYDPEFRWDSEKASCYTDIVSNQFTCRCPASP